MEWCALHKASHSQHTINTTHLITGVHEAIFIRLNLIEAIDNCRLLESFTTIFADLYN